MAPAGGLAARHLHQGRKLAAHAKRFDAAWAALDKRQISKIKAWSTQYLTPRKPVVFYMFSGPDFLYADAFYPGADTYVMAALEPVGEIPDLTGMSAATLSGGIGRIESSLNSVLSYSFFITKKMRDELSGGRFGGTLPILYVFLARSGKTIHDASLVTLDADGNVKPANDRGCRRMPGAGRQDHLLDRSRRQAADALLLLDRSLRRAA